VSENRIHIFYIHCSIRKVGHINCEVNYKTLSR